MKGREDVKWERKLSDVLAKIEKLISEKPGGGKYLSVAVEFSDIHGSPVRCQWKYRM